MNKTTLLAAPLFAFASLTVTAPVLAQHNHHGSAKANPAAANELADGEVRRVDAAKGRVLLRHGEIKSIGMSPMTMEFRFRDAAMAADLKAGDKVKFAVEQKGDDLIITRIEKVK